MNPEHLRQILHDDVVEGAKALLGAHLVRGDCRARIVEVEAYRSDDPACHAFRGRTPRTEVMHGEAGISYVYFNYGVHWMLNVVAHGIGDGSAVLIRAAEPLSGLHLMASRRGRSKPQDLLSGPGKLAQAFGITGADNGIDLLDINAELHVAAAMTPCSHILSGPRVGIAIGKWHEVPWRFVDGDQLRWISVPMKAPIRSA
jgi:DNA-3-methyladenine glycosylase